MITSVNINDASILENAINEIGLPEFIVPGKSEILLIPSSASPCPIITIGSINFAGGATPIVGESIQGGALISGGVAPFTLGTVTGDVPGGLTPGVFENAGNWFFVLIGTPTTFGVYTFTVTVLDDNGCESTPKEFTVLVGESFENTTPVPIVSGEALMDIVVSGLPNEIGLNCAFKSVEINATVDDLSGMAVNIISFAAGCLLVQSYTISGANFTGTVFTPDSATSITTGTAPYTGSWADNESGNTLNADFDGQDPNTTYTIQLIGDLGTEVGSLNSAKITFIPIQ